MTLVETTVLFQLFSLNLFFPRIPFTTRNCCNIIHINFISNLTINSMDEEHSSHTISSTNGIDQANISFISPSFLGIMRRGANDKTAAPRKNPHEHGTQGSCCFPSLSSSISEDEKITFYTAAEFWRFMAYLFFWMMVMFAVIVTKVAVVPRLAAGPATEGETCGPFDLSNGEGFDFNTENHLIKAFGYSNICAYWDYSPSRELTAMVFPLFEYSFMIYIILDYITVAFAFKRGEISPWLWYLQRFFSPVELVLTCWFRKNHIFVLFPFNILFRSLLIIHYCYYHSSS